MTRKVAWVFLCIIYFLIFLVLASPAPARAATGCDEWANMVKILVMRWQKDPQFVNVGLAAVKEELKRTMGGHPEIETALKWVDYAHKHKDEDPVAVWKGVYGKCGGTSI